MLDSDWLKTRLHIGCLPQLNEVLYSYLERDKETVSPRSNLKMVFAKKDFLFDSYHEDVLRSRRLYKHVYSGGLNKLTS